MYSHMASQVLCNVNLSHKLAYYSTKSNRSKFRQITGDHLKNAPVPLPGKFICDPCRYILRKLKSSESVVAVGQKPENSEVPHSSRSKDETYNDRKKVPAHEKKLPDADQLKKRKGIFCSNPVNLHERPRRRKNREHLWHINGVLTEKYSALELQLPVNTLVCLECRVEIYRKWMEKKFESPIYCLDPLKRHFPLRKRILQALEPLNAQEKGYCQSIGADFNEEDYICSSCRDVILKERLLNLASIEPPVEEMEIDDDDRSSQLETANMDLSSDIDTSESDGSADGSDEEYIDPKVSKEKLLKIAKIVGVELLSKSELRSKLNCRTHNESVMEQVRKYFKSYVGETIDPDMRIQEGCSFCNALVESIVEKFGETNSKRERFLLLTSTPRWVSISQLRSKFGISQQFAQKVSRLRKSLGPCSAPEPKIGRKLPQQTTELVRQFYLHPDNSSPSPSQRDTVLVRKQDGVTRERVAKHQIMCTMKQLYSEFCSKNPTTKISISKFASLKPRECFWGFHKGFQQSCLCTMHSNFNLMLDALSMQGDTRSRLMNFFCSETATFMLGQCSSCPKLNAVEEVMEKEEIEFVDYWFWGASPNSQAISLEKKHKSMQEFLLELKENVTKMGEHHFIYIKQRTFINELKNFTSIDQNTAVIHVDFAQNYSFVVANPVQGFHWNNSQCTVHPFCTSYKDPVTHNVMYAHYVVISDYLQHDATSFHAFRSVVMAKFKDRFSWITKIVYVSDGASSQYKNYKNFCNLFHHFEDFGIQCSWVFCATSHGKDVVDAISAVTKRLVRLESLRRKDDYLTTSEAMFSYLNGLTTETSQKTYYIHVSASEVAKFVLENSIEDRYLGFATIPGTRKYHHVETTSDGLSFKLFSSSIENYNLKLRESSPEIHPWKCLKFGQYAIFYEYGITLIGMVLEISVEGAEIKVQLMKKQGKGKSYAWCDPPVVHDCSANDFISEIKPPNISTASGRSYVFDPIEIQAIKHKYGSHINFRND